MMDTKNETPLVSVSMIAFHAGAFIARAIEGVLNQRVAFPVELVIGDDCSRDNTRAICEAYAEKYPGKIRVLPQEPNLGIGANTARTMGSCRGKYIAVCDGDDIWTDPDKLQRQVDFLEKNAGYGAVYTDVETISDTDEPIPDKEQDLIREMYAHGDVFIPLLQANFINNSTAIFRRDLIANLAIQTDRSYQIPDHIRWLHIAAQAKIHFLNYKSTQYRKHAAGLSVAVPDHKILGNRRMLRYSLLNSIPIFVKHNTKPLLRPERIVLFRRTFSVILRGPGPVKMRLSLLPLAVKFFPGVSGMIAIGLSKLGQLLPSFNKLMLISDLKELNA